MTSATVITTCIVLVCVIAWAYLVYLHRQMPSVSSASTSMMDMGMRMDAPWSAADIFFTFTMWAVMMVGMMTATAAPVLLLFAASSVRRAESGGYAAVIAFALGYLAIWFGFSGLATGAQWTLHQAALLSPAMATTSPRLAAALLIAAGVYQLTPLKRACLRHCQTPMGVLMSHWREGAGGAFQMGLRHGISCLGCCWVLMCVLFAVGIMNLVWVALLTAFILLEKLGTGGERVSRIGGIVLIAFGVVTLARTF
jgi:predicted metal-binding membrane protein